MGEVTNSGSGPLPATEEGGGRPGTLWFEPFALCGSRLLLPGSSSCPRACTGLKAQVSPGRRESGKGAGSGWRGWKTGTPAAVMAVLWAAAGHKGKGKLGSPGQVLEKEGGRSS